jgi:hypothetical protein
MMAEHMPGCAALEIKKAEEDGGGTIFLPEGTYYPGFCNCELGRLREAIKDAPCPSPMGWSRKGTGLCHNTIGENRCCETCWKRKALENDDGKRI